MGLEKINEMRKYRGMSIDELSEKSGVPKGTLSKITAGITKNPSVDTVKSIVHALQFTLDDLDSYPNVKRNTDLSMREVQMVTKYRCLNNSGKDMVDMVLEKEYERSKAETPTQAEPTETTVKDSSLEFDHLMPIAAHLDNPSEEQMALVQKDLERLMKLKEKM